MKKIFYFSEKGHFFAGADFINEDAEMPKYATEVDPFDTDKDIYDPIVWNGTDWTYGTKEEFEESQSKQETTIKPTPEQIALTALAQGYSKSLERIKSLEESTTALAQDLGDEK